MKAEYPQQKQEEAYKYMDTEPVTTHWKKKWVKTEKKKEIKNFLTLKKKKKHTI